MNGPSRPLRIAVADDDRETRDYFRELLPRLGHQVAVAESGRQLIEQCRLLDPDLVITDIKMPDLDGIAAATEINRGKRVPVILVSAHHDADLLQRAGAEPVMAYLVKPVKQADVESAIRLAMLRFDQYQTLHKEAASLRQALEDRKVIERAKGAVMKRLGVDEAEAFRRIKKLASDHNRKVVEVSQRVLGAEEVFRELGNS
jgi:response regulator NasT